MVDVPTTLLEAVVVTVSGRIICVITVDGPVTQVRRGWVVEAICLVQV
jgi:hypothetical protein